MHKFISESNSFAACLLNCEKSVNLYSKFTRIIIKCTNIVNDLWKSKRNTVEYQHDTLMAFNVEYSSSPMIVTTVKHLPIVEYIFKLWFRSFELGHYKVEVWHKQDALKEALDTAFPKFLNTEVGIPPIKIFRSKLGSNTIMLSN